MAGICGLDQLPLPRLVFLTSGLFECGRVLRWHGRFLAREQVFDGEYLKAGELPERRIEHASTNQQPQCLLYGRLLPLYPRKATFA